MYCPECGYENPANAKFCIGCRYEYQHTPNTGSHPQLSPSPAASSDTHDVEDDSEKETSKLTQSSFIRLKTPLRGFIWGAIGFVVFVFVAGIVYSYTGIGLAAQWILQGVGGAIFGVMAVKNFLAMPRSQKLKTAGTVIAVWSLTYFLFARHWISFIGYAVAAALWWVAVGMSHQEKENENG